MGDQIYTDTKEYGDAQIYKIASEKWGSLTGEDLESHFEEACDIVRGEYRKTYSLEFQRVAMANASNIMMFDDHEVRDDWGFREEDYTEGTFD
jgi:phosphodiesterase/alkaline phosphatase D-like protein